MREMAYAVRNALQQSGGGASWRDELRRSPQHNTRVSWRRAFGTGSRVNRSVRLVISHSTSM